MMHIFWVQGELESQEIHGGMQPLSGVGGNAVRQAFEIRDSFKNYFVSPEGQVSWQNDVITRGKQQH